LSILYFIPFPLHYVGGVIDRDYTGEIKVILINHGDKTVEIKRHNRVAQLVVEQVCGIEPQYFDADTPTLTPMDITSVIDKQERGLKGFGSTGD
jgi:dUTP pyrophosphatase